MPTNRSHIISWQKLYFELCKMSLEQLLLDSTSQQDEIIRPPIPVIMLSLKIEILTLIFDAS